MTKWLLVACLAPAGLAAQGAPGDTLLAYPNQIELEMLVSLDGDATEMPPGLRLRSAHRLGLHTSVSGSGLLLSGPLHRTTGLTAGLAYAVPMGGFVVEPSAEVGAALVDARVDEWGYSYVDPQGNERYQPRYAEVGGVSLLAGAGLSASRPVVRDFSLRLSATYLHTVSGDHSQGAFRLGFAVGRAKKDLGWYRLGSDRGAPVVALVGSDSAEDGVLRVSGGAIQVLAADENGIARIAVNRRPLELFPLDDALAARGGVSRGGVGGRLELEPPPAGQPIEVVVTDSAGRRTRVLATVFGPPDATGPAVTVLEGIPAVESAAWLQVRAFAGDRSGVADATLGQCPIGLWKPDEAALTALALDSGYVRVEGGAPLTGGPLELVVRDRLGNETRIERTAPPAPAEPGPAPRVAGLEVVAGPEVGGQRSVRVRGQVGGAPIAAVAVDGEAALLHPHPERGTGFLGWALVPASQREVGIRVESLGGAVTEVAAPIDGVADVRPVTLHRVELNVGSRPARLTWSERAPGQDTETRRTELGARVREAAVLRLFNDLADRLGPDDVLLFRVSGRLVPVGPLEGAGVLLEDAILRLDEIGYRLRTSGAGLVLLSSRLEAGEGWKAIPRTSPGVRPPAGCLDQAIRFDGGILDLGDVPVARITDALSSGDADGDGTVRALELVRALGLERTDGLLPYDPLAPVAEGRTP